MGRQAVGTQWGNGQRSVWTLLAASLAVASWSLGVTSPLHAAEDEASSPTRFSGQTVVAVGFEAPSSVPTEELRYLVSQETGHPYNPQAISRSLELLYRLGQFDAVRAQAQPVTGGVALTFVMVPSPRLGAIRLRGARGVPAQVLRSALSKVAGDPYLPQDEVRLARELEAKYRAEGFLDASVEGRVGIGPRDRRIVELRVETGRPYRVGTVRLPSIELRGFEEAQTLRMMGPKLRPGGRYREEGLRKGIDRLLDRYRKAGFVEARLLRLPGRDRRTPVEVQVDRANATVDLVLPIDAGRLVEPEFVFSARRRPEWTDQRLREVIGLESAQRASDSYGEEAGVKLIGFLRRRGHFQARVGVVVEDLELKPRAKRGAREPLVSKKRIFRFTIEPGPPVLLRSRDIVIEGDPSVPRSQIVRVLSEASPQVLGHRPPFWVVVGLPIYRRYYTPDELKLAISVLEDYYRARGFLAPEIRSEVSFAGADETWVQLTLQIDEGFQTRVVSLQVSEGLPVDPVKAEHWRKRVEGKAYNPSDLDALRQEVQEALGEDGYLDAEVTVFREFSDDKSLVRISVEAMAGESVRFGQLVVRDSRHTQVGLIRQEILLRPGEVYRPSVLEAAQGRLLRTGLFDGVVLKPAQPTGRVRDVELLVNERDRFSFLFGAGVTAPDDGPRVSGEVRLRNLDGRGLSLWARGRLSIDWDYLQPGVIPRPEYRATIGAELPAIPGLPIRGLITGVINEELDEPTYRLARSSVALSLVWRGVGDFTFDGRIESQFRAPLRVDPVARLSLPADLPTTLPAKDFRVLPLVSLRATLDKRDDRFNPKEGLYLSADLVTTPGVVPGSAASFGRLTTRVVGLIPFGPSGIGLQLEGGAGVAWSYDEHLPPVEWRFRLGGTSTLRGHGLDQVGPWGFRPSVLEGAGLLIGNYEDLRVVVGGDAFYRYSVQLQFPLPFVENWKLVVFHDAGNALLMGTAPTGVDAGRDTVLYPSVGFGLRRITPIGPLRLDLAFRTDTLADAANRRLGEVVQLHFAVGAL